MRNLFFSPRLMQYVIVPIVALLIQTILPSAQLRAQRGVWQSTGGPEGGRVYFMMASGAKIWAMGYERIFRSTDNGESWRTASDGISGKLLVAVGRDSLNRIYAAYDFGGIFVSTDEGDSWTPANNGLAKAGNSIALGADHAGNIYTIVHESGFYRSTDGGGSWKKVQLRQSDGTEPTSFNGRAITTLPTGTILAGTAGGLYRSTDNGVSWEAIDSVLPSYRYVEEIALGADSAVYATISTDRYRSTDDGRHWTLVATDNFPQLPLVAPSGAYFRREGDSVMVSTDRGVSWRLSIGRGAVSGFGPMAVGAHGRVVVGTNQGIYATDDNGGHWVEKKRSFAGTAVLQVAADSGGAFYVGVPLQGLYRRSNTNGAWENIGIDSIFRTIGLLAGGASGHVYLTSDKSLFTSSDRGDTWKRTDLDATIPATNSLLTNSSGTVILMLDSTRALMSTDHGVTWNPRSLSVTPLYLHKLTRTGTILASNNSGLFLSSDTGSTWNLIPNALAGRRVRRIVESGRGTLVATTDSTPYRSLDGGQTWSPITLPFFYKSMQYLVATRAGDLVTIVYITNSYYSSDDGNTWSVLGPRDSIHTLGIPVEGTDGFFYAASADDGVLRTTFNTSAVPLGGNHATGAAGLSMRLETAGNSHAVLRYTTRTAGRVLLELYNLEGRCVTAITSEVVEAGNHRSDIDLTQLPSGFYLCRLSTVDGDAACSLVVGR